MKMSLLLWRYFLITLLFTNSISENVEDLGCWKDSNVKRSLQLLENKHPLLKDSYRKRSNPVIKCAQVANQKGFAIFALQNGGQCFGGKNENKRYDVYGPSNLCKNGTGGRWSNNVYSTRTAHKRTVHNPLDPSPWDPYCTRDLDIVLLLDGSGSKKNRKRWDDMLLFAQKFVKGFDSHARIGVEVYGGDPQIPIDMLKGAPTEKLVELIKNLEMPGGKRMLNDALKVSWRDQLKETNRSSADKVIVALTTGNVPYGLYGSSQFLSDHMVRVVAVGVDRDVNYEFLQSVASYRDVKNIFSVNHDQLGDIAPFVYRDICNTFPDYVSEPTTTLPPTTTSSSTPAPPQTTASNPAVTGNQTKENASNATKGSSRDDIITIPLSELPIQLIGKKKNELPKPPKASQRTDVVTVLNRNIPKEHLASMVLVNPNPELNLDLTNDEVVEINSREHQGSLSEKLKQYKQFIRDNDMISSQNEYMTNENPPVAEPRPSQQDDGFISQPTTPKTVGNEMASVTFPDSRKFTSSPDEFYINNADKQMANRIIENGRETLSENSEEIESRKVKSPNLVGSLGKPEIVTQDKNENHEISHLFPSAYKNASGSSANSKESKKENAGEEKEREEKVKMKPEAKIKKLEKEKEKSDENEEPVHEKMKDKEKGSKNLKDFRIEDSKFKPKYIPQTKSESPSPQYLTDFIQKQDDLKTISDETTSTKPGELMQTTEMHSGNGKEHVSNHPHHSVDYQTMFSGRLLDKKRNGKSDFFTDNLLEQRQQTYQPTQSLTTNNPTMSPLVNDGFHPMYDTYEGSSLHNNPSFLTFENQGQPAIIPKDNIPQQNQEIMSLLGAIEKVAQQTAKMAENELKTIDDNTKVAGSNVAFDTPNKKILEIKGRKIDALLNSLGLEETRDFQTGKQTPEIETKQLQDVFNILGSMFSQYATKKGEILPQNTNKKYDKWEGLLKFHPIKVSNRNGNRRQLNPAVADKQHKIKNFLKAFEEHLEDITSSQKLKNPQATSKQNIELHPQTHVPNYRPKASDNVTTFPYNLPFATKHPPLPLIQHPTMGNAVDWGGNAFPGSSSFGSDIQQEYNNQVQNILMRESPVIGPTRSNIDLSQYYYPPVYGQTRQAIPLYGGINTISAEIQNALEENGYTDNEASHYSGFMYPETLMRPIDHTVAPPEEPILPPRPPLPQTPNLYPVESIDATKIHEKLITPIVTPHKSKNHPLKQNKTPILQVTNTGQVQHSHDIALGHVDKLKHPKIEKNKFSHLNLNILSRKGAMPSKMSMPTPKPPSLPNMPSMPQFMSIFKYGMKPSRMRPAMKTRPLMKDRKAKDATRLMTHVRKKTDIKHLNSGAKKKTKISKSTKKLNLKKKSSKKGQKKQNKTFTLVEHKHKQETEKTGTGKQLIPKTQSITQKLSLRSSKQIPKSDLKKSTDYYQPLSIFAHGRSIHFKTSPSVSKILLDGIVEKKANIQNMRPIQEKSFPLEFSIDEFTLDDLPMLTKGQSYVLTSPEEGLLRVAISKESPDKEVSRKGTIDGYAESQNKQSTDSKQKQDKEEDQVESAKVEKQTKATNFNFQDSSTSDNSKMKNTQDEKVDAPISKINGADSSEDGLVELERENNKLMKSLAGLKLLKNNNTDLNDPLANTEDTMVVTHEFEPLLVPVTDQISNLTLPLVLNNSSPFMVSTDKANYKQHLDLKQNNKDSTKQETKDETKNIEENSKLQELLAKETQDIKQKSKKLSNKTTDKDTATKFGEGTNSNPDSLKVEKTDDKPLNTTTSTKKISNVSGNPTKISPETVSDSTKPSVGVGQNIKTVNVIDNKIKENTGSSMYSVNSNDSWGKQAEGEGKTKAFEEILKGTDSKQGNIDSSDNKVTGSNATRDSKEAVKSVAKILLQSKLNKLEPSINDTNKEPPIPSLIEPILDDSNMQQLYSKFQEEGKKSGTKKEAKDDDDRQLKLSAQNNTLTETMKNETEIERVNKILSRDKTQEGNATRIDEVELSHEKIEKPEETTVELQNTTYKIYDPYPGQVINDKQTTDVEKNSYNTALGNIKVVEQPKVELNYDQNKTPSKVEEHSYNPKEKRIDPLMTTVKTLKKGPSNMASMEVAINKKPLKNVSLAEAMAKMNGDAGFQKTNITSAVNPVNLSMDTATMLGCSKPLRVLYMVDVSEGMGRGSSRKRRWNRLKDFIKDVNNNILKGVTHEYMVYNTEPRILDDLKQCDKNTELFTVADDCLCNKKYNIVSRNNDGCSVNQPTMFENLDDYGKVGPRAGKALQKAKQLYFNKDNERFKNVILLLSHKQSVDGIEQVEKDLKVNGISLIDIELGQRHDLRRRNFIPKPAEAHEDEAQTISSRSKENRRFEIEKQLKLQRTLAELEYLKSAITKTRKREIEDHEIKKQKVLNRSHENIITKRSIVNDSHDKKDDETHKVKVSLKKLAQTLKNIIGTVCKTNIENEATKQLKRRSIRSIDFYR